MKNIKFHGFTLAEVLTAMMVLGVTMALTLPSVINSHERNTTQAGIADAFKEFNKAVFNYSVSKQCQGQLTCTGIFDSGKKPAEEISSAYSIVIKKGKDCWEGQKIANNLDQKGGTTDLSSYSCFVDGKNRIWAIDNWGESCTKNYFEGAVTKKHKLQKSCGYLFVDINGAKRPNTFGRDVFAFIITDATSAYLYPVGGSLASANYAGLSSWKGTCGDGGSQEGRTCAGRFMEEGWKIHYLK